MAQERKFARNLTGPGSAAKLRETVAEALKESHISSKPKLIEPLDYETVVVKNKTLLQNDPHREMLLFPPDDVGQSTLPRRFRTTRCSVPPAAIKEATTLFVREAIKTYTSNWSVIHYKYSGYSGSYLQLPRIIKPEALPEHIFEVDAETEGKDEDVGVRLRMHITKQGWLYKGPDSSRQESSIISFTRSFKRRYFYLKQQADTTYILEFHKDDRKIEAKGSIFLDSATGVNKSTKRGKHSFELHMQDKSTYLFAAESETEMEEWVSTLKRVLVANEAAQAAQDRMLRGPSAESDTISLGENFRDSLEHSMNPELQKYARETDSQLASQRKESRQNLFNIYTDIQKSQGGSDGLLSEGEADAHAQETYRETFGTRFIVRCDDFKLRLQANLSEDAQEERLSNPEPFYISFALFDAKEGKKISEDFRFDPNSEEIRSMVPEELLHANDMLNSVDGCSQSSPQLQGINPKWIAFPKLAIFSVTRPHPEIYLVARIEKVLQGGIGGATEPYMKTPDIKHATKMHKQMKVYCQRLGHYRMPFAWAARPVFKPYTVELDTYSDFVIYKQEANKLSEEDLIKSLQDLKKPEKQGKWMNILGLLKVTLYNFKPMQNVVTGTLLPVKPFPDPPEQNPAFEVEEFVPSEGECSNPYVSYVNHLYVYPKTLKYDSQKSFTKARNIACCVEIRESDEDGSLPLKSIYGSHGHHVFTTCATCAVIHHTSTPDYNEEVKIALPTQLHGKHHLVFTFFHVSCDLPKVTSGKAASKKEHKLETPVGYAWFPLLTNNSRVNVGEQNIRVSMNIPPGYLGYENLGMGKGSSGVEVRWVDGARPVFKFAVRAVSTIYTKDQHLHNFFSHCEKMDLNSSISVDYGTSHQLKHDSLRIKANLDTPYDKEMLNFVKSLHAIEAASVINFLPTLFNQLLRLLTQTNSEDVALNTVKVMIHIVSQVHDVNKTQVLHSYVKYVFVTEPVASVKQKSVHEELAHHLKAMLLPTNADKLVIGKFMKHSWFFFELIIKSMAQHLLSTGRIKMARNERFPSSFQLHIQNMIQILVSHVRQKSRDRLSQDESKNANISIAAFIKKCFTFLDRGFVFKLINLYIDNFLPADPKLLHEYKFEFLRSICNHEHFVQLNLPIMRKSVKNYKAHRHMYLKHDYTLSDEFRKNHFLVGLLLHEVKMALNEMRDVRKPAMQTLRNLLAKHAFDDRYSSKAHQSRIATLYLPFITVILEIKERLNKTTSNQPTPTTALANGDAGEGSVIMKSGQLSSYNSTLSIDSSISPYTNNIQPRTGPPSARGDPTVFAVISGQGASPQHHPQALPPRLEHRRVSEHLRALNAASISNLLPSVNSQSDLPKGVAHHGSSSSLASSASSGHSQAPSSDSKDSKENKLAVPNISHQRAASLGGSASTVVSTPQQPFIPFDKLDPTEIKDLLICFLYIVKNLSEEILLGWFNNSSETDVIDFFTVLETCMHNFKYMGRKRITSLHIISDTKRAMTLPAKGMSSSLKSALRNSSAAAVQDFLPDGNSIGTSSEADAFMRTMMEANLSSEVALIVLDVVSLFTQHFKEQMQFSEGNNPTMQKVFDLYLHFLQTSQSETVQKHAFAALRSFINKFSKVLFQGEASMCGRLCYEILRCCNSRLNTTRSEACALMYLLMRSNFEFSKRKSFTRVHLQMIISVAQLIGDVVGLSNARFTDSLSVINSYANNDKAMQKTVFPIEVKDLTKRIRTVLMATAQMKEHLNDKEMLIDLQYSLAKSYASTPELRRTWLESMAKIHIKNQDYSEAAHCYIHIAALVAEYLRRRDVFPQGCRAFRGISPNVEAEESGMRDDSGMQDVQYTEENLVELLEECAEVLEKAERYELLGELYRLIIPIYERRRAFVKLAECYARLQKAYNKVVEVMSSGKRLLGKYFRVAFFGQAHFEDEDGKEYIYKEPKITALPEICERLRTMYAEKYGRDKVELIKDSTKVNQQDLDPGKAYIQVTYVTPFFDAREAEERLTDFERNNNLRRFMYETPFTKNGKARGEVHEQYKRRTILTTSHSFPYVKKRILVVYHKEEELSPIEVAIDEMKSRVSELDEVISQRTPDVKRLQLKLQGSVSAQVNAGPMAYAEAFLAEEKQLLFRRDRVQDLKQTFREFISVCGLALDLNGRLIEGDQYEYQENMRQNFREMVTNLQDILDEQLFEDEKRGSLSHHGSMTVFSVISSTGSSTNV